MCHAQTDMARTYCDYKAREHGMSESDMLCSNKHGTYILWLQSKRAWKVRRWSSMFKQTWHLPTVITKQESMESQKVIFHVQTDMALTRCNYKAREHGKSESDVSCSNRHGSYPLWLQSKRAWKVRKWCAMFKQTWHLLAVITKQESMESQKVMCHIQTDMALTYCDYKVRQHRE